MNSLVTHLIVLALGFAVGLLVGSKNAAKVIALEERIESLEASIKAKV